MKYLFYLTAIIYAVNLVFQLIWGLRNSVNDFFSTFTLPYITIVPMAIGAYFVYVTYLVQKGNKQLSH